MSANPQSIISSRIHTNNVFKGEETKKGGIQRENNTIKILNTRYEEVGTKIEENNKPKEELKKRNSDQMELDKKSFNFDDKILKSAPSSCFITLNRLLYSKKCVRFYIFLIVFSVFVLFYSVYGYFAKLNEFPIIICEMLLTTIVTLDMLIRIYTTGCRQYFNKFINWLDLLLLLLSIMTIVLYLKFHNLAQKLEDISFALLIFIRNSSQFLRLIVLLKNQKEVRKNVEEIIHFSSEFGDKKGNSFSVKKQKKVNRSIMAFVDDQKSSNKNSGLRHNPVYTNFQEQEV